MGYLVLSRGSVARIFRQVSARGWLLLGLGVAAVLIGQGTSDVHVSLAFAAAASVLGAVVTIGWLGARYMDWLASHRISAVQDLVAQDIIPSLLTDATGEVNFSNGAATSRFGDSVGEPLATALKTVLADPAPILTRLRLKAAQTGGATEDIVIRRGHLRITVRMLDTGGLLWRCQDVAERSQLQRLALGADLPMLTIGRNDAILSMNDAARRLVGERIRTLDRLSAELPLKQGHVHRISTLQGLKSCIVIESQPTLGRREMYLLPVPGHKAGPPSETDLHEGWRFFDALPVPLLKLDPDGAVLLSNLPARELLRCGETAPQRLSDLMEGLGRSIADWLAEAAAGRSGQHSEFLRLTRSDTEVFVQVTLNKVHDRGKPALIAVLTDATELKTLEAQFVQSQKMQAIGELAGGVAHDFNNLLTAISGHCDLLLLRHDQGDPEYGDLVQIHQNANRAAALVGQLLAFSRKQTLRPEVLDLRDTLSDLTHLLNRLVGEKITLTLTHEPVLQAIRADKRQLEQVLMNLVVNARDAMPGGGEIRIQTEGLLLREPTERDRVTLPAGTYVSVQVSDHGHGIPADKLQKVFEPFYTTKRTGEGTGLGLSTAYGIVKQSGGYIFVDSVVGQGTCFTLLFPGHDLSPALAHPSTAAAAAIPVMRHGNGVVLLVEDEAPVRAFASRALRLRGYTVIEADSAEQALSTLEDETLEVDLFVTDVIMPGKDGPTWVREALEQRPGVGVVFVSGYAEESFGDAQARIPNSVFLPKPFSLNDLTETVNNQLQ